ncbi:MAG: hypothetical protein JSV03_00080, partial [Planctomycetota bacterium]
APFGLTNLSAPPCDRKSKFNKILLKVYSNNGLGDCGFLGIQRVADALPSMRIGRHLLLLVGAHKNAATDVSVAANLSPEARVTPMLIIIVPRGRVKVKIHLRAGQMTIFTRNWVG